MKEWVTDEEFEKIVEKAFLGIPLEFRVKLANVTILTGDYPTEYQLRKLQDLHGGSYLLGLYEGVPIPKRGQYTGALPDKITIFKKPIEAISNSREQLEKIVYNTILHEIAHHFGMNEEEVRAAGR